MEPMYPVDPVLLEEVPMPPAMHAEARGVIAGRSRNHRVLRSRVLYLFGSTLVVDAIGTVLMYVFEHAKAGSGFEGFGGALFWVSAQLTTVSSQMPNPVTTPGRIVDLVLEVWAISVVATLAASLAAFFHARHIEDIAHHVRDRERRRKPPGAPPV